MSLVLEMNRTNYGILAVALLAIVLASSALAMNTGYLTKADSAGSSKATPVSPGQSFMWRVGEVIDVQGNLYAYSGLEINYQASGSNFIHLHFARWQNGWIELRYFFNNAIANDGILPAPGYLALYPYQLRFQRFYTDKLNATFLES